MHRLSKLEENDPGRCAIIEYWQMLKDLQAKEQVEAVLGGIRYCWFRKAWNSGKVMLEVWVSEMSDNVERAWMNIRTLF